MRERQIAKRGAGRHARKVRSGWFPIPHCSSRIRLCRLGCSSGYKTAFLYTLLRGLRGRFSSGRMYACAEGRSFACEGAGLRGGRGGGEHSGRSFGMSGIERYERRSFANSLYGQPRILRARMSAALHTRSQASPGQTSVPGLPALGAALAPFYRLLRASRF